MSPSYTSLVLEVVKRLYLSAAFFVPAFWNPFRKKRKPNEWMPDHRFKKIKFAHPPCSEATITMIAAHMIPAQIASRSGSVDSSPPDFTLSPLSLSNLIRTRSLRRRTVDLSPVEESFPKQSRRDSILKKLAGPRENAKRFFRLRSSGVHSPASPPQHPRCSGARPVSEIFLSLSPSGGEVFPQESAQGEMRSNPAAMATDVLPRAVADHPDASAAPELTTTFPTPRNERIVATGSGLTVGLALTEPVLYLQGYDQHDPSTKKSAILRGQIHLKVTKCVKIKKISICFRGHAQTDWPDGTCPPFINVI